MMTVFPLSKSTHNWHVKERVCGWKKDNYSPWDQGEEKTGWSEKRHLHTLMLVRWLLSKQKNAYTGMNILKKFLGVRNSHLSVPTKTTTVKKHYHKYQANRGCRLACYMVQRGSQSPPGRLGRAQRGSQEKNPINGLQFKRKKQAKGVYPSTEKSNRGVRKGEKKDRLMDMTAKTGKREGQLKNVHSPFSQNRGKLISVWS